MDDASLPYRRLIAALLLKAVRDAQAGDREAAEWLQSEEALAWAMLLELDWWPPRPEQVTGAGRPPPAE